MSETIYIWEKKVKGSVPADVSSVFATLAGGLERLERNYSPGESRLRETTEATMLQIAALEEMATSLVVMAIRTQTELVRARISRLENLTKFESSGSAIVSSCLFRRFRRLCLGAAWREPD
jgi:hypothetical protein